MTSVRNFRAWLPRIPNHSDWKLSIPPATQPQAIYHNSDVWSHDRYASRKGGNRTQEVTKQHHDTIQLDAEPNQRPPQQDERQPPEERRRPLCLVFPREEEQGLLWSNDNGEADQEEDLSRARVTSEKQGTILYQSRKVEEGWGREVSHTFPIASLNDLKVSRAAEEKGRDGNESII